MKTFIVSTPHEVSYQRVSDLLSSAWKGSAYWATAEEYKEPSEWTFPEGIQEKDQHFSEDYPLNRDGAVMIRDKEDDNEKVYRLDLLAIERGLALMPKEAPLCWADFLNENEDMDTGDAFLQLCLLGKVIYG